MDNSKRIKCFFQWAVFFISILIFPGYINGQTIKSELINSENSIKGFGDLTLGENVNLISEYKLNFMDSDSSFDIDGSVKYECQNLKSQNKLGDDIEMIGIRAYKNKIVNIYVFFKRENGYHIFQSFVGKYGRCGEHDSDFVYKWDTNDVKLYLGYDRPDIGLAVFSSKKLSEEMDSAHKQLAAQ